MATAILIYVPVAYLADRGQKKPFVAMTFVFFALFPLLLYFSHFFFLHEMFDNAVFQRVIADNRQLTSETQQADSLV